MSPHLSDEAASPPLQGSRRPPFLPSDPRPNAKSDAPQDDFGWDEWPEEDPESEVFGMHIVGLVGDYAPALWPALRHPVRIYTRVSSHHSIFCTNVPARAPPVVHIVPIAAPGARRADFIRDLKVCSCAASPLRLA